MCSVSSVLNPFKAVQAVGSLFSGGGSGGGSPLAKAAQPIGQQDSTAAQIGAPGATPGAIFQRRKPRSLLSMVGGIGMPDTASVGQPTLKPTLGG
jgi:hypothetical protein